MSFIDTHCHLDDERYKKDLDLVIKGAKKAGVKEMIIPAADPETLIDSKEIAHKYEGVYFACGIHPCNIENPKDYLKFVDDEKCVAIGECGLDYYYLDKQNTQDIKHKQQEIFMKQITFAIERDLPLIVHIREASSDALDILQGFPKARGVLHCYNADQILLKLSDRFYYGIGGVATFKNARRLIEVLPLIPRERLVLETDAPYLTPHPHRGERNAPAYIPLIAAKIAEVLEWNLDELASITTQNAKDLFALS